MSPMSIEKNPQDAVKGGDGVGSRTVANPLYLSCVDPEFNPLGMRRVKQFENRCVLEGSFEIKYSPHN